MPSIHCQLTALLQEAPLQLKGHLLNSYAAVSGTYPGSKCADTEHLQPARRHWTLGKGMLTMVWMSGHLSVPTA